MLCPKDHNNECSRHSKTLPQRQDGSGEAREEKKPGCALEVSNCAEITDAGETQNASVWGSAACG